MQEIYKDIFTETIEYLVSPPPCRSADGVMVSPPPCRSADGVMVSPPPCRSADGVMVSPPPCRSADGVMVSPPLCRSADRVKDRHRSPRNLYVVRQEERSLMIDTSFRFEQDLQVVEGMLKELGIDCSCLDIFITHDHPDHTGLVPDLAAKGARIFMNPEETRKRSDLLHCYLADEKSRIDNFRTVGVTREHTPEVHQTMMEYTNRVYQERRELPNFDFTPIHPGERLAYGPYQFEIVSLKGHTFGQCGLRERGHKLLFCGDQIMTSIVPIVGSQQKDLGLLKCYLDSLGELKHSYADYRMLPCHYDPIDDVKKEADRIVQGYMEKCTIMMQVLKQSSEPLTTRDVGVRAYGRSEGPPDYAHFVSCTQIWAKTFSCLEYLYGEGFVKRTEKEGILYWESAVVYHP